MTRFNSMEINLSCLVTSLATNSTNCLFVSQKEVSYLISSMVVMCYYLKIDNYFLTPLIMDGLLYDMRSIPVH